MKKYFIICLIVIIQGCNMKNNTMLNEEQLLKEKFLKTGTRSFVVKKIKVMRLLRLFQCDISDILNVKGQAPLENERIINKEKFYIFLTLPKGKYIRNKDITDDTECYAEVDFKQ